MEGWLNPSLGRCAGRLPASPVRDCKSEPCVLEEAHFAAWPPSPDPRIAGTAAVCHGYGPPRGTLPALVKRRACACRWPAFAWYTLKPVPRRGLAETGWVGFGPFPEQRRARVPSLFSRGSYRRSEFPATE